MNSNANAPLSTRDLLILAVLSEEALHGYGLVKAVEAESAGSVLLDPANLYRLLARMTERGWIAEVSPDGYTRRRTYEITPDGRGVLSAELERLARMVERFSPSKTSAS
jgi:PadR family transcriptional regulator PadR